MSSRKVKGHRPVAFAGSELPAAGLPPATAFRSRTKATPMRKSKATAGAVSAPSTFIDPTTLPDEYAMRVRGDCLAPAIKAGDAVLFDQRQPFAPGDLVGVYLKAECSGGSTNVGLKRLVMNMMPGVTYPYQAHPDSNIMPVLVCEQDNPHRQYTIPADQILAIHRCMGLVPDDVALYDGKTGEPEYKRAVASAGWSRGDLLAGAISLAPVAGLAGLPVLAADEADPIFAAIEAHKAAAAAYEAAVDEEQRLEVELPDDAQKSSITSWEHVIVETDDPRWIAAIEARERTCDAVDELAWAFIEHPPTTAAGAAALMAYIGDAPEGHFPDDFDRAVTRVLAGVLVRTTGGAS